MNWDQINGRWKQLRGSVRTKWGKLTDDDIEMAAGNRDRFIGILQERYGIAKDEAQRTADEWADSLRDTEAAPPKTSTGRP